MLYTQYQWHQNFAMTSQTKYSFYRWSCGRDRRLDQVWGDDARTGNPWRTVPHQ